jgi:MoxR-like ATPase
MKPTRPTTEVRPVREKFATVRRELSGALIERDVEIDLALTALLAGEHLLLVGPPGCAKSLLLDALLAWTGGAKFSLLLTKFTTPEEVVGAVSLWSGAGTRCARRCSRSGPRCPCGGCW